MLYTKESLLAFIDINSQEIQRHVANLQEVTNPDKRDDILKRINALNRLNTAWTDMLLEANDDHAAEAERRALIEQEIPESQLSA